MTTTAQLVRARGEAEEIMHRLSRDMPGDETLAFALLGRMVDELRADMAALRPIRVVPNSGPPGRFIPFDSTELTSR